MSDAQTLSVYASQLDDYVAMMDREARRDEVIGSFIDAVRPGGRVLDLGCGPGHFARRMSEAGLIAEAWDAVPEMVAAAARQPGVRATLGRFEDLRAIDSYDGVWAYFSLLHAPRDAFPGHLDAIGSAVKPGGAVVIGMKRGTGGGRDRLGRHYEYYQRAELDELLCAAGMTPERHWTGVAPGLAGHPDGWIAILARA